MPYQHLTDKSIYDTQIRNVHLLTTTADRALAIMPALQEEEEDPEPEDKIQMPLMALGFPDEPSPPDGMICGAVLYSSSP